MPEESEFNEREALLERLRRVGLNRYESSVYLGLVTDQDAKVAEISRRTGVPQPKVYQALDSLVEKGFCALGSDAVNRYRPVPPRLALEGFLSELRAQEAATQVLADDLDQLLQEGKGQELWAPPVEVVKGMRHVKRLLTERIEAAREEVLSLCKGPHIPAREIALALAGAAERGVVIKLLSDRSYYDSDEEKEDQIAIYRNMPAEKRELESVPTKMLVVDRQIAIVSITRPVGLHAAEDFMILVLRHEGLVQHFLASFEHGWERARPVRLEPDA